MALMSLQPQLIAKLAPVMRKGHDDEVSDHTWVPDIVEEEIEEECRTSVR